MTHDSFRSRPPGGSRLVLRSVAVAGAAALALSACAGVTSTGSSTSVSSPVTSTLSGSSSNAASTSAGQSAAPPAPAAHQTENNPAGDIPDQQAFVSYTPPGTHVSVKVPEGWARSAAGGTVTFTDKLNSITLQVRSAATAPTMSTVTSAVVPQLTTQVPAFSLGKVSTVSRAAGQAVLVTYLGDTAPDPVTNKVIRDSFERYSFWHAGTELVLTLSGPQNADNVDPWKTVTDSVRWQ